MAFSTGNIRKYVIVNAMEAEPPVKYVVGVSWATTGGSPDHCGLTVAVVKGLASICQAYSNLPGLGGWRSLWMGSESPRMLQSSQIAKDAAFFQISLAALQLGKTNPLNGGGPYDEQGIKTLTIEKYFDHRGFDPSMVGNLVAHAGLTINDLFMENWGKLVFSADEWPKEKWSFKQVTKIKVLDGGDESEVSAEVAAKVLDLLKVWQDCKKDWGHETPMTLAKLLP